MRRFQHPSGVLLLFLGSLGAAIGLLVVMLSLDLSLTELSWLALSGEVVRSGGAGALSSLGEVLAAVLGLSLTVVAIVVQLASQRYSPKLVDIFMRDRVNLLTFGFMVMSCIYVVVLPTFVSENEVPVMAATTGLVLAVLNFGLLLPYFGYVFTFLHPNNIITEIESQARYALKRVELRPSPEVLRASQEQMSASLERISDNCITALLQSDRGLALHSVWTMEKLQVDYIESKAMLSKDWFNPPQRFFIALSHEFYAEIVQQQTWVEAKALMEFEHLIRRALGSMDELVSQLASSSRVIGLSAVKARDHESLELVLRFFNTYIRHGLNARNVRAIYNVLYQYRMLAVEVMGELPEFGRRVVQHMVYYGRLANAMGLPFVTVTTAHDVRVICEEAFKVPHINVVPFLDQFLTLDQPSEVKTEELALLGFGGRSPSSGRSSCQKARMIWLSASEKICAWRSRRGSGRSEMRSWRFMTVSSGR